MGSDRRGRRRGESGGVVMGRVGGGDGKIRDECGNEERQAWVVIINTSAQEVLLFTGI
jgi:hypothetical protein